MDGALPLNEAFGLVAQVSTGTDSDGRNVVYFGGAAVSATVLVLVIRAIGISISNRPKKN
jgi:hypothetical protein